MGERALCLTLKIHDKVLIPTHPTIIHTREKSGFQNSLNAATSHSQHKTLRISLSYFSGRGTARSQKPHSQSSYHWPGRNGTFQVPIIAIFSVRYSSLLSFLNRQSRSVRSPTRSQTLNFAAVGIHLPGLFPTFFFFFFFFLSSPDSSHTFVAVNCGVFWW